jgi:M6 family metalloprotease-like protein
VTKRWVTLPRPIEDYRISPRNLEVDKSRIERLIRDSLDAIDKDYDVSAYDSTALFLGARRAEYGMIGLCGYPGMLGWSQAPVLKTKSGRTVRGGVAIFTFQAHLGTLFHDTAHILGGVKDGKRLIPCLYDHDLQARPGPLRETFEAATVNMGMWDPMSCHYVKWEAGPPGISSWTRLRLGWIDERRVKVVARGAIEDLVLAPLGDRGAGIQVVRIPLGETTYWLIENRQPMGFDANLPGSGVLILKADDSVAERRHGKSPVRLADADPSVPNLAGAAFGAQGKNHYLDEASGVRVEILEKAGNSFKVRIDRSVN